MITDEEIERAVKSSKDILVKEFGSEILGDELQGMKFPNPVTIQAIATLAASVIAAEHTPSFSKKPKASRTDYKTAIEYLIDVQKIEGPGINKTVGQILFHTGVTYKKETETEYYDAKQNLLEALLILKGEGKIETGRYTNKQGREELTFRLAGDESG